jgi:hypothetical protein
MLEAHIVSPRGSLFYAGESHPYDLETLWEYVREAGTNVDSREVQLEVIIDDDGIDPRISAWVHKISAIGVQVKLLFTRTPSS